MIQHHIDNRWSALNAPMSHTVLRMIRNHPSFIPRLIPMKMVTASSAVGYATIDGDKILINPPPPTEFDKSLAWLKDFIEEVKFDAWQKWGDGSWLGDGCNPTEEEYLKHLDVVSKGKSSPDVS